MPSDSCDSRLRAGQLGNKVHRTFSDTFQCHSLGGQYERAANAQYGAQLYEPRRRFDSVPSSLSSDVPSGLPSNVLSSLPCSSLVVCLAVCLMRLLGTGRSASSFCISASKFLFSAFLFRFLSLGSINFDATDNTLSASSRMLRGESECSEVQNRPSQKEHARRMSQTDDRFFGLPLCSLNTNQWVAVGRADTLQSVCRHHRTFPRHFAV